MKRIFLTSGLVLCMACPAFATDTAGFTNSQSGIVADGCDYGDLDTFTGPTQLKAIWTANGYTLEYIPNAPTTTAQGQSNIVTGLPSPNPVAVTYDSQHIVATPSLTGYTLKGWTASADIGAATDQANNGTTYYAGSTIANYKGVGAVTMTADWTPNRYDVTYANSAGTVTDTHTDAAIYDANYDALGIESTNIATPAGHTFIGWSSAANPTVTRGAPNGTTPVNTGTVSNVWTGETPWRIADDSKTVYAAFLANQYNITYSCTGGEPAGNTGNVNGMATGDAPANTLVTYGENYTLATNTCTLQGYNFAGWECEGLTGNTVNDNGNYNAGASTGAFTNTANVACKAKWTPGTITDIQWDADGGSYTGTPSTSCTYDDEIVLPTNPQKTGYTFGGWEVVGHNPSQPQQ